MRKKLRGKAGLTIVEMLAATMILTLLALMLGIGLQMVTNTYQTMIAQSELELLLSTAVDTLSDDLRFARDVRETGATVNGSTVCCDFTFFSDFYYDGETEIWFNLDNDGQIRAWNGIDVSGGRRVLSTGVYGSGAVKTYKEYEIARMEITYKKTNNTFDIYLKAQTKTTGGRTISTETTVTVRCLNPAA